MKKPFLQVLFAIAALLVFGRVEPAFAQRGGHGGGGFHGGGGGFHGGGGSFHGGGGGFHGGGGFRGGSAFVGGSGFRNGGGFHSGGGFHGSGAFHGGFHGGFPSHGFRGGWGWGGSGWGWGFGFGWGWPYWGYTYPYGYAYDPGWGASYYDPYYYPYYPPPPPPYTPPDYRDRNPQQPKAAPKSIDKPSAPPTNNSTPPSSDSLDDSYSVKVSPASGRTLSRHVISTAATASPANVSAASAITSNYNQASPSSTPPRREVLNAMRALREMPPFAREREIDHGRYSKFSAEERELLRNSHQ